MVKVFILDKSNNVSRGHIFEKFFQCVGTELSLTCCIKISAVLS